MLTQKDFVELVRQDTQELGVRVNDPDYTWHKAHYPRPRRLGGRECVPLTEWQHAVQGVLQSEEEGLCSLFGWEGDVIRDGHFCDGWFDLLDACDYWISEGRREAALKLHSLKLSDGRSAHAVKAAKARHASKR